MDNDIIKQKNEKVLVAVVAVGLVLIVMVALYIYSKNQHVKIDHINNSIVQNTGTVTDPFANMNLFAHSAVVWDVKNQKFLYKKNEQDVVPLASLTKLMTALAAVEILPNGSNIKITNEYLQEEAPKELLANENWDLRKLISLTLLSSSNAGARAIATVAGAFLPQKQTEDTRQVFIDYLNKRAGELKLDSMRFYNDSGLDLDTEESGAYGSAQDVAKLMDYIIKTQPNLLESTKFSNLTLTSNNNSVHQVKNTNIIIDSIPGVAASKTGYTDLAQGNLMVEFSPGLEGPYVAVVLGSTFEGRFTDIDKLINATIQNISK